MESVVDSRDQVIAELRAELALLRAEVAQLREENAQLKARLKQNSTNSSKPPSTDPPGLKRRERQMSGRNRGGQPGHKRHLRELVPIEQVDEVRVLRPSSCDDCGKKLHGADPSPRRHQVLEVPEIKPSISEWQLHALRCSCGKTTRAQLPTGVPRGAFGPVFSSVVALCTYLPAGAHRDSSHLLL